MSNCKGARLLSLDKRSHYTIATEVGGKKKKKIIKTITTLVTPPLQRNRFLNIKSQNSSSELCGGKLHVHGSFRELVIYYYV